jgi:hypothetical protein
MIIEFMTSANHNQKWSASLLVYLLNTIRCTHLVASADKPIIATERHNGKITAMSSANGGAKFEITLPNNGDPQATLEI